MASSPRSRLFAVAGVMLAVGLGALAVIIGVPLVQGQGFAITLLGYLALAIAGTGLVLLIVAGAMSRAADRDEPR